MVDSSVNSKKEDEEASKSMITLLWKRLPRVRILSRISFQENVITLISLYMWYFVLLNTRLKCTFHPLSFKKLRFWPPMNKNDNFGPLRFSPFAIIVLLVNFDSVNAYVAGHMCNY